MYYSSLNNPDVECKWVEKVQDRGEMVGVGQRATLREILSIYACVCPIYCKPRCNPEQEAGQGVTVGVKAPLLP